MPTNSSKLLPAVWTYQPVAPGNNKYLGKILRWDQEILKIHRRKVVSAKAAIDNDAPRVHTHLLTKLKKLQLEEERVAIIERDNRILLEKMAHITRTGGVVDHKKEDYHTKSLNKDKRHRELLRVTHENIAMFKRLSAKDPHYSYRKLLVQWQVNEHYAMNISKYAHPWRQEQSPYIAQAERMYTANKRINRKVNSVVKSADMPAACGERRLYKGNISTVVQDNEYPHPPSSKTMNIHIHQNE